MTIHRLRQKSFWGDYGSILANGLGAPRDPRSGLLLLDRAGPFAPPMMFTREPLVGFIVLVTGMFREKLMTADFGELDFKPVVKSHIVSIPWETWDRTARFPLEFPTSGEPEEFILGHEHSIQAAAEMDEIWEFIAPAMPCKIEKREPVRPYLYRWYLTRPEGHHRGLFRSSGKGHVLFVDDAGRQWFEREANGWVDFDEVVVV
jgi:hypothetical protein